MPSLTPTSTFNCNTAAFSFAPRVPHEYNPQGSRKQFVLPRTPMPVSLLKSISALRYHLIQTYTFFWTGYWTKSSQDLQMCWPASQEVCLFGLASCTGYMNTLHCKAITAASQAKRVICKPSTIVKARRV